MDSGKMLDLMMRHPDPQERPLNVIWSFECKMRDQEKRSERERERRR